MSDGSWDAELNFLMQTEEALLNARLGQLYHHMTRGMEVYDRSEVTRLFYGRKVAPPETSYGTKVFDVLRVSLIPQVWLSPKFVPTVIGAILKKPFEAITDCPKHNLRFIYHIDVPVTRARLAYSPVLTSPIRDEQDFDLSEMLSFYYAEATLRCLNCYEKQREEFEKRLWVHAVGNPEHFTKARGTSRLTVSLYKEAANTRPALSLNFALLNPSSFTDYSVHASPFA